MELRLKRLHRKYHDRKMLLSKQLSPSVEEEEITSSSFTSILPISHQVYAEAAPILYGNNQFNCHTMWVLYNFLPQIRKCVQHLRFIQLDFESYDGMFGTYVFSYLEAAIRLEKIHIYIQCWTPTIPQAINQGDNFYEILSDCSSTFSLR